MSIDIKKTIKLTLKLIPIIISIKQYVTRKINNNRGKGGSGRDSKDT
jgi:hypothetical protein